MTSWSAGQLSWNRKILNGKLSSVMTVICSSGIACQVYDRGLHLLSTRSMDLVPQICLQVNLSFRPTTS